jgi:hypothetical protein
MTSIVESADTYDIRVLELVFAAWRRDSAVWQLEFRSPTETWTMIIEGGFTLTRGTEEEGASFTPPVSDLVGESVRLIRVRKANGELEIELAQWTVTVAPDDDYEAWQMYSSNGERLMAVPGDGVAIWKAVKSGVAVIGSPPNLRRGVDSGDDLEQ